VLLRGLLGLEPAGDGLIADPALPSGSNRGRPVISGMP
jgi:hypothetical protein